MNAALAETLCVYQDRRGELKQATSIRDIPEGFRRNAQCAENVSVAAMADPREISLKGTVRHETTSTSIGKVELRWPRSVEDLFGRTPQRALAEATRAISALIRRGGFPPKINNLNLDIKMVFLDEDLPETQIPQTLISNCHPGWMVPPGNVYIVGQRVATGCSGPKRSTAVADSELARVLIHELGHVLEFNLIPRQFEDDRMRAEGFASCIEQYASDLSPLVPKGSARNTYETLAKMSFQQSPDRFVFSGSAPDYGRASMYCVAIVERRGITGLMDVYETIGTDNLSYFEAIRRRLGWDQDRLNSEVDNLLR